MHKEWLQGMVVFAKMQFNVTVKCFFLSKAIAAFLNSASLYFVFVAGITRLVD